MRPPARTAAAWIARALFAPALFVAAPTAADDARATPPTLVRVAEVPFLSWAPLFLADAEGFFARWGIEVSFVRMTGNTDALPLTATGRMDVAPGLVAPGYLNLMARGAGVRFVADKGHAAPEGCAYRGILARRELVASGALDAPGGLRGRRVATERTSPSYYELDNLLAAHGLTAADVTLVDVPYAAKLEAFARGSIDLTTASEPWLTRIVDTGHAVLWKPLRDVVPRYQHSFLLFGPTLLRDNRDAGARFLAAYLEALEQYAEGKTDRNVEILAARTGLDPDFIRRTCWTPIRTSGELDVESVLDYQRWALGRGLLDALVPPERFWDGSLLEDARRLLDARAGSPSPPGEGG